MYPTLSVEQRVVPASTKSDSTSEHASPVAIWLRDIFLLKEEIGCPVSPRILLISWR